MPDILSALRARGVGAGGGLSAASRQALIDIANAADGNNDDIKVDVVNKLKAINPALQIGTVSTWTEIRAAIATMLNQGSPTFTPGIADQALQPGYFGGGKVLGDPDLVSPNIKAGANIFNVVGKNEVVDTTTAAGAAAGEILEGREVFVNGAKRTGTIPNKSGVTGFNGFRSQGPDVQQIVVHPDNLNYGSVQALIPSAAYVDHTTVHAIDVQNLIPANIRQGVKIGEAAGGMVGTYVGGARAGADDIAVFRVGEASGWGNTAYACRRELLLTLGGTFRIGFSIRSGSSGGTAYGQIYRNGVPVGIERTVTSTSAVLFEEDIAGWMDGDRLQIYLRSNSSSYAAYVSTWYVRWTKPTVTLEQ